MVKVEVRLLSWWWPHAAPVLCLCDRVFNALEGVFVQASGCDCFICEESLVLVTAAGSDYCFFFPFLF